jgi:hypothetical protein
LHIGNKKVQIGIARDKKRRVWHDFPGRIPKLAFDCNKTLAYLQLERSCMSKNPVAGLAELVVRPVRRLAAHLAVEDAIAGLSLVLPPRDASLSLEWSTEKGESKFSVVAPRTLSGAIALQLQSTLGVECMLQESIRLPPDYGVFLACDLVFYPMVNDMELQKCFDCWNGLLPCKTRAANSHESLLPFQALVAAISDATILLQLVLAPFEGDVRMSWLQTLHSLDRGYGSDGESHRSRLLRTCATKVSQACWLGNLRAYVSASTKHKVTELATALSSAVAMVGNYDGAIIQFVFARPVDEVYSNIVTRQFTDIPLQEQRETSPHTYYPRSAFPFTPAEIVNFWQPVGDLGSSYITPNARLRPAPQELVNQRQETIHFGIGVRGTEHVDLFCPTDDLCCHTYIRGMTGTGKTSLISQHILDAFRAGESTIIAMTAKCGEAQRFLGGLTLEDVDRVLLLDQTDYTQPFAFNLLDVSSGGDSYLVAEGAVGVLHKLFADAWGPETERVIRNSCLTLTALPHPTLLDLHRLLTDANFRREAVSYLKDAELRRYWEAEFERYDDRLRQAKIAPTLNKLWAMTANPHLRAILSRARSSINMPSLIESGKLVLVQLDPRQELAANLLGALLLTAIEQAAMARVGRAEARPVLLFVDEFQNLVTEALPKTLAEARAGRLHLRLIHQYGEQVERPMLAAILANCGIKVFFRCAYRDAIDAQNG